MPIQRCSITKDGKTTLGWKWGNSGKCYTGKDAKQRAGIQGAAAHAAGYTGKTADLRDGRTDTNTVLNDNTEGYRNPNRRELKSSGKFQSLVGRQL